MSACWILTRKLHVTVVPQIRSRVIARNSLREQVSALARKPQDIGVHSDAAGALPPVHPSGKVATLVDWAEVDAPRDAFAFAPRGMALVKARLAAKARPPQVQVPDDDDSDQEAVVVLDEPAGGDADNSGGNEWAQMGAKYYRAVFSFGDGT